MAVQDGSGSGLAPRTALRATRLSRSIIDFATDVLANATIKPIEDVRHQPV